MPVDDLKRFRRLVRKLIRDRVKETREPPPLSLWVSHGARPQRAAHVPIGAAASSFEVMENLRECVLVAGASFCALGRALADVTPGGAGPILTTEFGLVIASVQRVEAFHATIRAGTVGAWEESASPVLWAGAAPALLQSALRAVPEDDTRRDDDVQARIDAAFRARTPGQKDSPA